MNFGKSLFNDGLCVIIIYSALMWVIWTVRENEDIRGVKENEKEIFIDEMADLGDEWTIEELKGTSYEKMSLERAIRERKSALGKMDGIIGTITF